MDIFANRNKYQEIIINYKTRLAEINTFQQQEARKDRLHQSLKEYEQLKKQYNNKIIMRASIDQEIERLKYQIDTKLVLLREI